MKLVIDVLLFGLGALLIVFGIYFRFSSIDATSTRILVDHWEFYSISITVLIILIFLRWRAVK